MHATRTVRLLWVAATLSSACAGCARGGRAGGEAESIEQLSIAQVGQILRIYQKGEKPPPKGLAELLALENGYPAAIRSIRDKDVLVYWGVGFSGASDAGSTVLAYQKDVPEKGGEVLMLDGAAKTMTADEFKAAAKPPGASTDFGPLTTKGKTAKKRR